MGQSLVRKLYEAEDPLWELLRFEAETCLTQDEQVRRQMRSGQPPRAAASERRGCSQLIPLRWRWWQATSLLNDQVMRHDDMDEAAKHLLSTKLLTNHLTVSGEPRAMHGTGAGRRAESCACLLLLWVLACSCRRHGTCWRRCTTTTTASCSTSER